MGSELIEHFGVLWRIIISGVYEDVDRSCLGPLEVRECPVEIGNRVKLETSPERRAGYEDRAPIPTNVRGADQRPFLGAILEDLGQNLWRKLVNGNIRVPDRPDRVQTLGEVAFDGVELWHIGN